MCDGGNPEDELAYGNHPSVSDHRDEISYRIISDVVIGHALVFDAKCIREILRLRVFPLGNVEEPKFRIVHDLTLAVGTTVRSSVDFTQASECRLRPVVHDFLSRVLYVR